MSIINYIIRNNDTDILKYLEEEILLVKRCKKQYPESKDIYFGYETALIDVIEMIKDIRKRNI